IDLHTETKMAGCAAPVSRLRLPRAAGALHRRALPDHRQHDLYSPLRVGGRAPDHRCRPGGLLVFQKGTASAMTVRPLRATDRDELKRILEKTQAFSPAEIKVALELIDFALGRPGQTDYYFQCVEDGNGKLGGYMCYGE